MGEYSEYDKLSTINTVYHNTLVEVKVETYTTESIKAQLLPHQMTLVHGMHQYRDKMIHGFLVDNHAINGKIGIIGDRSGTGKTLSVLAYLASHSNHSPRITSELTPHSSKYFFSHDIHSLSDTNSTNLIVVPHHLFVQWRNEIEQHTTIDYTAIETKRMIKGDDLAARMVARRFVLTTNKCYKFVQAYATHHNIQWNNVFIDEASSIYINSSDPPLNFQFLWLITNNWIPLLFKNPSIIKSNLLFLKDRVNLHPEFELWLLNNITVHYQCELSSITYLKEYLSFSHPNRGCMVLRNSDAHINSSMPLMQLSHQTVYCKPNISLHSLTSFYVSRNTNVLIRSEKVPYLFQSLGIQSNDSEEYLSFQTSNKHNLIKRKIEENECLICFEQCEYPTILNCCYNVYCGKCLLKNTLLTYKCPTCREVIDVSNICCLSSSKDEIVYAKSKSEVCLDIIRKNMDAKMIVYCAFDNIYYQLFDEIDKMGLKAERLESNIFSLLKTIRNFKEGCTNILFISNVNCIRGLSLPSTSHLIFYHDLPVYELKEALIHSAQRIGRLQPLSIFHLHSEIQV